MLSIEERIPIARVPALVGKSIPTIYRWFQKGVKNVRLRTELIGGQRYTCQRWIDDFLRRLNEPSAATEEPAHVG